MAENNDTLTFNGGTVKEMVLLHLDTAIELLDGEIEYIVLKWGVQTPPLSVRLLGNDRRRLLQLKHKILKHLES